MGGKRGAYSRETEAPSAVHAAKVIFRWRRDNGITQAAYAAAADVKQGYVSRIEKGEAGQMRLETAAKLCIGAAILCKRPIGGRLELESLLSPKLAAEYRRKVLEDGTQGKVGEKRKRKKEGTQAVSA